MRKLRVFSGRVITYANGLTSAIGKSEIMLPLMLTPTGLASDEQEMKRHHGGPDRALLQYPPVHYDWWKKRIPEHSARFEPALFGENLSVAGFDEGDVHIGDIFSWGEALIQVSQPRSPCYRLDMHLDWPGLALIMQQQACCGWLYRVLKTGMVSNDMPFSLAAQGSNISIKEAMFIMFGNEHAAPAHDPVIWRRLMETETLSESWKQTLARRLETGAIESWKHRLEIPSA
ncbi:MAG: MOSC domain-containing protein [Oxalobacter sp.]|nr:MOSC domain-containing protein [Oxalobacter sp.]